MDFFAPAPECEWTPEERAAYEAMNAILVDFSDTYTQMNALREWINAHYPDFELYLEDTWNERAPGQTDLEYILRSRQTLNETPVLAYDIYHNHRDVKGVWHLDDYVASVRLMQDPAVLLAFIRENRAIVAAPSRQIP